MANELATAYIQLLPSFRGLQAEIDRGLAGAAPAAKRAGGRAGDSFVDGFRSSKKADGSALVESDQSKARQQGAKVGGAASDGFDQALGASNASGAFSRSLEQERGSVAALGTQLGDEAGSGISDGVGGGLSGLPESFDDAFSALPGVAAAAGAAGGALVVKGISDALARGAVESQLEASLGISESAAAQLGASAGATYAQNYGDSVEQVADATARVQRSFGQEGLGASELEDITKAALTTSTVFDQDLNQSINSASQLLRTGLAKDGGEAFDIITTGLQGTANKSDDFLDTLNEYSTQFRKLGLDGTDALNLVTQAVNAGARDSDIAADALKEFSIRAVDGSATTSQAFASIGLSSDDMVSRIAQGGPAARGALQQVLEGLRGIEDPALRSQVAVQLFGTQAEDLGDALFALDLDTLVDGLDKVPGSAQRAQEALDDTQSSFEKLKRAVFAENASIFEELLAAPAEIASDDKTFSSVGAASAKSFVAGFAEFFPVGAFLDPIKRAFGLLSSDGDTGSATGAAIAATGSEAESAAPKIDEYEQAAKNAGVSSETAAGGADALKLAIERAGVAGRLGAVGLQASAAAADAYLQSVEDATRADDQLAAGLRSGSAIRGLLEGAGVQESSADRKAKMREAAVESDRLATQQLKAATTTDGLTDSLRRLDPALSETGISLRAAASGASAFNESIEQSTSVDDVADSALSLADAYEDARKSFRALPDDINLGADSLGKLRPRQRDALRNMLQLGDATRSYLGTLIEQGKGSDVVRREADKLRQSYVDQFRALGKSETQIQALLEGLGLLPSQVETAIRVSGIEESRAKLEAYTNLLQGKIPGALAASVITAIEAGDLEGASKQLATFAATNPIDIPVSVSVDQTVTTAQDALDDLDAKALELPKTFDRVTAALGGYTEEQTAGLEAWLAVGDSAQDVIGGLIEDGDYAGAEAAAQDFRDTLTNDVLPALGITDETAQQYYLTLIGLDGTTVTTAIEQAGVEEALQTLGLYEEILKNLGTFSLEDQFKIADLLNAGDIDGAKKLIEQEVDQGRAEAFNIPVKLDTTEIPPGLQTLRNYVATSPPAEQPLDFNKEPAETNLDTFRGSVAVALPFLPPLSFNIGPALTVLDVFRKSVEKADDFVIGLAFDVVGFFQDVGKGLGVSVEIAKFIWGEIIDKIPGFADGGLIEGAGGPRSDSIMARVSAGEYIVDAATVRSYGVDFFDSLKKTKDVNVPGFAMGGIVAPVPDIYAPTGQSGINVDYTVVEAQSRPRPDDLVRVIGSGVFLGASA